MLLSGLRYDYVTSSLPHLEVVMKSRSKGKNSNSRMKEARDLYGGEADEAIMEILMLGARRSCVAVLEGLELGDTNAVIKTYARAHESQPGSSGRRDENTASLSIRSLIAHLCTCNTARARRC